MPALSILVPIECSCDSFSGNVKNKFSLILSAFPDHTLNPVQVDSPQVNSRIASFAPATINDERTIIMSSQISHVVLINYFLIISSKRKSTISLEVNFA